jgi:ATP:corrinoid adenosyltransferase
MTISINPTWEGNNPAHEFDSVEDAVAHIKANPSYEYLQNKRVRPFGDIDHKAPDDMDEYEFEMLNTCVWMVLKKHFEACNRKVALYSASSFEYKKISWRWVVPDVYVESYKHAKVFAEILAEQMPELKKLNVEHDTSIYSANRKMRMVGTSKPIKKGKYYDFNELENRPLVCDNCDVIDTIITYIPEDAEFIDLELPDAHVTTQMKSTVDDTTILPLLECIALTHWKDYKVCMRLVWAMCSCGVSADVIHAYCSKAPNYEAKWVDDLIKNHNKSVSPQLSYLRKYGRAGNPTAYSKIQFNDVVCPDTNTLQNNIQELFALTTDSTTIYDTGRYMMPIPDEPTVAIKGLPGLGKTTQVKKYIKRHLGSRILVLSGRRTFSDAIYADLKDDGFIHYEHHKAKHGKDTPITADKVVAQVSARTFLLIKDQSYDIIICDEIETLLTMLSPSRMYKSAKEYVSMYMTFERVMTNAKSVVCMDAFLSNRTMDMLHTFRGKSKIIINETNPYKKKYREIKGQDEFLRTLTHRIRYEKKRIVSVWGTVKAGEEFYKNLKHYKVPSVFYHGKSNEKEKALHMSDVNTHWANLDSVNYTGTLTVGVNYDNKERQFDQLSLYASSWGCGARDYAQALHRAREVKDNELLVHISPNVNNKGGEAGFVNQVDMWDAQTEYSKKCLEELGEVLDDYTTLPEWLRRIILWNRNEVVLNRRHLPELMREYLHRCGIEEVEVRETTEKPMRVKQTFIPVEDVRVICDEEAEYLSINRKTMSEDDHHALDRYYLSHKVKYIDQFIWEQWLKNKSVVENAYLMIHSSPTELLQRQDAKVIELMNKNIPRLKLMQSLMFDWTQSWELPVADVPEIDLSPFSLRKRTQKDTHEQHCREIAKSIKNWCGYAISVKQKRVKKNGECFYEYSMVYDYDASIAKYIEPKYTFEEE